MYEINIHNQSPKVLAILIFLWRSFWGTSKYKVKSRDKRQIQGMRYVEEIGRHYVSIYKELVGRNLMSELLFDLVVFL